MKKLFLLLILFNSPFFAQQNTQLSNKSEVSILTCAPGASELYSLFGHTAIRVKDPVNNIDKIYNYGTFDFNTPNFYLKFCRGQLLYQVSSYPYKYFPYQYHKEKRWIKAQILNFTVEQNQQLFDFLQWNILDENKNYHYDFFYDNCATKIHEIIEKSVGEINFDYNQFPNNLTHRNLIHLYLAKNSWSKFGIDLALGAVIDKKATFEQYMFLPDYVLMALKNSKINGENIIKKERVILPNHELGLPKTPFILSPLFLAIILLAITFYLRVFNKNTKFWFNMMAITYGILGFVIFCLWFLTEHSTTKVNMNILWANPILLAYPFIINKNWRKYLSCIGIVCLLIFLLIALSGFQQFDLSFYLLSTCLIPLYLKPLLTFEV